ncbi:Uncharacterised protein [Mycobacteroides abscessus subsp. abscessus]|nr:Uncharacterised protein [Mycobacteroides abscessus subsp. abscessus]
MGYLTRTLEMVTSPNMLKVARRTLRYSSTPAPMRRGSRLR